MERIIVHQNRYQDSARLMRLSSELKGLPGVSEAEVLMGTDMNRELLRDAGYAPTALEGVAPMDLVVALRGADAGALDAAASELERLLEAQPPPPARGDAAPAADLGDALSRHPDINLVSVAVPGLYAGYVARQALQAGRHVFLFSDNVPLEEEVTLKRQAAATGRLLMGPDCGTAILAGVGLGFANRVRRGAVGLVGASGTGIQEISTLVHQAGAGVSQAIGTGSHDLSAAVGGIMTEMGVRLLDEDPDTAVIVVVAKPPDAAVAERLHGLLASASKPVVVRYLGQARGQERDGVTYVADLDEAARVAVGHLQGTRETEPADLARERRALLGDGGALAGRLLGLFGGGSLASEAALALRSVDLEVEVPATRLDPDAPLPGQAHVVVDVGDDFYTVGKPHPMVDQTTRCELIRGLGADPGVSMLLLDLVLGDGAHPDPAPEIVAAVEAARKARNTPLLVVASVTGTDRDPQDAARQRQRLASAGIAVQPSATRAAQLAAALLTPAHEGSPS